MQRCERKFLEKIMLYRKIGFWINELERISEGEFQPPVTIELDLTNKCQNDCSFCMYARFRKEHNVNLDKTVCINLLKDLRALGTSSITFTGGGEPTLHPNFIDIILESKKLGFKIGLLTNGILINKIINYVSLFEFIRVSLDSGNRSIYKKVKKSDYFNTVIRNIKLMRRRRKQLKFKTIIGASFVVCKENERTIEQVQKIIGPFVDYLQIKPEVHDLRLNKLKKRKSNIIGIVKRYRPTSILPCQIAGLVGSISATGDVFFCCQTKGDARYAFGNVYNEPFSKIWNRRKNIMPDINKCVPCRYMNYAKEFEKYKKEIEFIDLKHKEFL